MKTGIIKTKEEGPVKTYESFRATKNFTIELTEIMLGTVPKDKEVYATYIESKKPKEADSEVETVEEIEEKGWTGFHSDENGLFIYDYMVKGYLKDVANKLKDVMGIKAMRAKIADYVFVTPRRVYLGKTVPDGMLERPLRAQTMQGPRVTLARSDYVNAGTHLTFTIGLLKNDKITWDHIDELLKYATDFGGLGQNRSSGYGKFVVK